MNFWETFYKNKLMLTGSGLVLLLLIISLMAPWLAPYDPGQIDLTNVLASPSMKHLFGTDQLGRDVLSRMIWGARISLKVGFVATGIAIIIGSILGAVSGYYGGWIDSVIMRFVDIMLCFPTFFLILAVIAFLEPSIWNIMIIIGLTGWMGVTRLVRADFISLAGKRLCSGRKGNRSRRYADYFSSYPSEFHGFDFSRGDIGYCRRNTYRIGLEFFRHRRAAPHTQLGQYLDCRLLHILISPGGSPFIRGWLS